MTTRIPPDGSPDSDVTGSTVRQQLELPPPRRTPGWLLPIKLLYVGIREYVMGDGLTRASALTFTSLLALVPLTVVGLSIYGMARDDSLEGEQLVDRVFSQFLWPEEKRLELRLVNPPGDPDEAWTERWEKLRKELFFGALSREIPQDRWEARKAALGEDVDLVEWAHVESSRESVVRALVQFVENLKGDLGTIGIIGACFLLITSISLFSTIEATINALWGLQSRRHPVRKFLVFWALLTLGPLLLGASFAVRNFAPELVDAGLEWTLVPYLLTWAAFFVLYRIVPDTKVNSLVALAMALLAGSLWEGGKFVFGMYAVRLFSQPTTTSVTYGSLALVPTFMLWVYLSWVVVLAGVQLCAVWQNLRRYSAPGWGAQDWGTGAQEVCALRICAAVADRQYLKGRGSALHELLEDLGVPQQHLEESLDLLVRRKLLRADHGGDRYMLAWPPDRVRLDDVMTTVRGGEHIAFGGRHAERDEQLFVVLDRLAAERRGRLRALTLADLQAGRPGQ